MYCFIIITEAQHPHKAHIPSGGFIKMFCFNKAINDTLVQKVKINIPFPWDVICHASIIENSITTAMTLWFIIGMWIPLFNVSPWRSLHCNSYQQFCTIYHSHRSICEKDSACPGHSPHPCPQCRIPYSMPPLIMDNSSHKIGLPS